VSKETYYSVKRDLLQCSVDTKNTSTEIRGRGSGFRISSAVLVRKGTLYRHFTHYTHLGTLRYTLGTHYTVLVCKLEAARKKIYGGERPKVQGEGGSGGG
jgi:hypothetical protein